jgi:hypothetical protein
MFQGDDYQGKPQDTELIYRLEKNLKFSRAGDAFVSKPIISNLQGERSDGQSISIPWENR